VPRALRKAFTVGMSRFAIIVLVSAVEDLETLFGPEESGQ
jgi:hypothetical protein